MKRRRQKIKKITITTLTAIVVLAIGVGSAFAFGLFNYSPEERPKKEAPLADREGPSMMSVEEGLKIAEQYKVNADEKIEYSDVLKTDDDEYLDYKSEAASYTIQASTGRLSRIRLSGGPPAEISVSMEEAERAAREAVAKYRSDFDLNAMTKTTADLHESKSMSWYEFEWRSVKQGVDIGRSISVDVTGTGAFMGFSCYDKNNADYEPDMSNVKVSAEEAKALAIEYMKSVLEGRLAENLTAQEPNLKVWKGELCWEAEVRTYQEISDDLPPDEYFYLVTINAETGEVVNMMAGK